MGSTASDVRVTRPRLFCSTPLTSRRYNGHLHMKRLPYVAAMAKALDRVWAELAASFFRCDRSKRSDCARVHSMGCSGTFAQLLAGPHSRDYDTLSGRGGVYTNLFLQGVLPWANLCSRHGLHCEDMGPNTYVLRVGFASSADLLVRVMFSAGTTLAPSTSRGSARRGVACRVSSHSTTPCDSSTAAPTPTGHMPHAAVIALTRWSHCMQPSGCSSCTSQREAEGRAQSLRQRDE